MKSIVGLLFLTHRTKTLAPPSPHVDLAVARHQERNAGDTRRQGRRHYYFISSTVVVFCH